jgi:hypothetical protein
VTVEPEVPQNGKNEKKREYTLLPVVDVVLCFLVKITVTIITIDITTATKTRIKNVHNFILPPARLNNEY